MEKTKAKKLNKKIVAIFRNATEGCNIQHGGSPCNNCFHSIGNDEKIDWRHVAWVLFLRLRGDYKEKAIIEELKKSLRRV